MTLPIDCSSSPVPAASSSSLRDASPASWFFAVWTLVSELSRRPLPDCVREVLCPPGRGAQGLSPTFFWFHRNWSVHPQKRPPSSTENAQIPTAERDSRFLGFEALPEIGRALTPRPPTPEMDEGPL